MKPCCHLAKTKFVAPDGFDWVLIIAFCVLENDCKGYLKVKKLCIDCHVLQALSELYLLIMYRLLFICLPIKCEAVDNTYHCRVE